VILFSVYKFIMYIYTAISDGELLGLNNFQIVIISTILLFFLVISYYKGYKLAFLLICVLFVTPGYFYTYQMQYNFPQYGYDISSSMYLEKSENFTFHWFKQYLSYQNKMTNLNQELHISNSQPVETYISFDPPENITSLNITIITTHNSEKYILLNISDIYNHSVYNITFPQGIHTIKMSYGIRDVEPIGMVRFWIYGRDSKPIIKELRASVIFSRLKYQCSNPCIIIPYNKGYYTTYDKAIPYQNIDRRIPAYTFNIYLENSDKMRYVLWTSYKNPIIIRNLLFALLVGLFIHVISILIEKREEYIQMINSSYHRVITKLRR